ncbi:uncharacterized protein BKA55DRAFT_535667 [Fusarium redolens]|uniref:Uncharacterized protein n=1 Tax=Fusarium redolens TaxID=48865 RepID=A0A9P9HNU2_FUSRE|nr:uncharacterized protein BKA55DRAFT_535667 [Fusarium redolens]KAH7260631.1 hypothetical protein BKA55DRAFT_535667 [Fusarium redolens]
MVLRVVLSDSNKPWRACIPAWQDGSFHFDHHPVESATGYTDSVEYLKFDVFRSLENQLESIWNSVTDFTVNWALNISTDISHYKLDDPSGNAWCTIEMCTAVIVVSLPGLKSLFVQSKSPGNTSDRSTNGYIHTSSRQPSSNRSFASRARIDEEALGDELELISYGRNSALATTRTPNETRKPDIEGTVVVTTDFTVTRELSGGPN